MSVTNYHAVLRSEELPAPQPAEDGATFRPAAIREVTLADRRVLVTRLESGEIAAFARHCPHLGTPLHTATVCGQQVRCAQHGYVYDAVSGRNLVPSEGADPAELARLRPGSLPTYPALERDGWIWVSDGPGGSSP